MNVIFYALVAIAVLVGALRGDASHEARVQAQQAEVLVEADSPVKVGSEAWVRLGDAEPLRGKVTGRERTSVTVALSRDGSAGAAAPLLDGPVRVRFPDEYPATRMGNAALEAASGSVALAIKLAGAMTLFLGLVKVLEAAGGMDAVARAIRPLLVRLFPDVPANHPAMGAIVLNLAANVLGLGNAATPFGIKAMQELDKLNPVKGRATNAMILFLAINTSGVAVLPTGIMAVRAAAGSKDPAAIFLPTLLATAVNTVGVVLVALLVHRWFRTPEDALPPPPEALADLPPAEESSGWRAFLPLLGAVSALVGLVAVVYTQKDLASAWILPGLVFGMLSYGVLKKVRVYETFLEGAKDGFQSSLRIVPFLVAVLVAVAMFRESGALGAIVGALRPLCDVVGMPAETLPLALLRPLSGSGAFALTTELTQRHGPDSLTGLVAGTMQGSTETTFYVLAVYFGAVGVTRTRHAAALGLVADFLGVVGSVLAVRLLLG
jgi:spore maturation protein SpmA